MRHKGDQQEASVQRGEGMHLSPEFGWSRAWRRFLSHKTEGYWGSRRNGRKIYG
jgi:hypothetical protein